MTTPVPPTAGADAAAPLGQARQLGHIVLYVADLDRSLAFYRDMLGWPVISPADARGYAGFRAGNTHHDLLLLEVGKEAAPVQQGRHAGLYHFGVKVGDSDDDLRALVARIKARPDIATVIGTAAESFARSLYVLDPDGVEVELYIDPPGADWSPENVFSGSRAPQPLQL